MDDRFNYRSWEFENNEWTFRNDAYFIRAVVQDIETGEVMELGNNGEPGNELDAWREFNVYRDSVLIGRVDTTEFFDILPDYGTFNYMVTASYHEGQSMYSNIYTVTWLEPEIDVPEAGRNLVPSLWSISALYPNPFNPTINVTIAVPEVNNVSVEVYDALGRLVEEVYSGILTPGYHTLGWQTHGPSALYFLRVSNGAGWEEVRKMVYLK